MINRWILFLACILLTAFAPIYRKHDSLEKVDREFNQIENDMQDQQFIVRATTPSLSEMRDGGFQVVASTGFPAAINILLRIGTTIYVSPNWRLIQGR